MRLWSIHPKYLDGTGLAALWREALLAQKVLKVDTKGYKNHPQLRRFRGHPNYEGAIAMYLMEVWKESQIRGYRFDRGKIGNVAGIEKMPVTSGQLRYEFGLLCGKLKNRNNQKYQELLSVKEIECHPLFKVTEGEVEEWEKRKESVKKPKIL